MPSLQATARTVTKACDEALVDLDKSRGLRGRARIQRDMVARMRIGASILLAVSPSALLTLGAEEAAVIGPYLPRGR